MAPCAITPLSIPGLGFGGDRVLHDFDGHLHRDIFPLPRLQGSPLPSPRFADASTGSLITLVWSILRSTVLTLLGDVVPVPSAWPLPLASPLALQTFWMQLSVLVHPTQASAR
jgi:hypothetical protein